MKQYRGMMVLAALCLAAGGVYLTLSRGAGVEQTGMLYRLEADSISQIRVENTYGEYLFRRDGDVWVVEAQGTFRTNPEKMRLMTAALSSFVVSRVLDSQKEDYGLDTPVSSVEFLAGGTTHRFSIGAETASRSSVYIRDETGAVMVTDTASVAQFNGSLAAYRDKEVFTIDKTAIKGIEYYAGGELVVSVGNNGYQDWYMTYPYEAPARQIELNELVGAMRGWTVAGYPEALDDAAMGLQEPQSCLVVTDRSGSTQRLEFGRNTGTSTYVRTGGADEIVGLYTVDLDFSVLDADALVFVAPLKATVDELESISVESGGVSHTFRLEQTEGDPRVSYQNKEISLEDFSSIFIKYIAMNAGGRDPIEDAAQAAAATLTSVYTDGGTVTLELLERDDASYYMRVDGQVEYYLAKEKLEQLLYRIENAVGGAN